MRRPDVDHTVQDTQFGCDVWAAAITHSVQKLAETTGLVTLYRAVITATEFRKHLERNSTKSDPYEVDSKTINYFLWKARAKERAANSILWIEDKLQLGWPVSELAEAIGIHPSHSCSYNWFSWLRPLLTETLLPPSSYFRKPRVAQPWMLQRIENAMERGASYSSPTWLAFLAIWLQAMTGRSLKYILRSSFPVERGAKWMTFFCKRNETRCSQVGFYWHTPSTTTSGFKWTVPFLAEYDSRRHSASGKSTMGMIFRTDDYSYLSTNMVNAITMQEVSKDKQSDGLNLHEGVSWRAILPELACLLYLSPDGTRASAADDEATIIPAKAKMGRMDMPCKLICAEVLNNLARDNVSSFDEVQSQQWSELAQSAMDIVNTEAKEWQFETHWLNLDVV